jgi:predicted flap endonuclease-1-like 5' DNA nuclease
MSQLTSGSYDLSIASLEIILFVAAAFIAGALLCYLLRLSGLCCRRKRPAMVEGTYQPGGPGNMMQRDPVSGPATRQQPVINATTDSSSGYEADISSLIRSSSDGDTNAQPPRTARVSKATTPPVVSFEERARSSLAQLRSTHSADTAIDYTLDIPVPDENHVDDLKKLEGINPAIEKLLNEAGIKSYAKLATMDRNYLKELLESKGSEFDRYEPKSWPYQAELAAKNNWGRLKEYQDFLMDDRH